MPNRRLLLDKLVKVNRGSPRDRCLDDRFHETNRFSATSVGLSLPLPLAGEGWGGGATRGLLTHRLIH
jgi:hypothetical protein